jgi:hypothetical protein
MDIFLIIYLRFSTTNPFLLFLYIFCYLNYLAFSQELPCIYENCNCTLSISVSATEEGLIRKGLSVLDMIGMFRGP